MVFWDSKLEWGKLLHLRRKCSFDFNRWSIFKNPWIILQLSVAVYTALIRSIWRSTLFHWINYYWGTCISAQKLWIISYQVIRSYFSLYTFAWLVSLNHGHRKSLLPYAAFIFFVSHGDIPLTCLAEWNGSFRRTSFCIVESLQYQRLETM